ncbi:hypothetical protein Acr_02g0006360 [Actinidia rufa]|uniref:Leucine-rich repeat-containing N-terminal plant-type domain-containing protein n=1 Tax=Actinidia rufa TaxID=165716 RepID=A0A7J0E890_9ERIC|nr:hypothetical protein Acr_02g0006360 [Actinidia rufa]
MFMIFWINVIPVHSQCHNDQKSLLIQLKNGLLFNSAISVKLVNWTEATDCCDWKGVNCDQDGHVIGLDLNSEGITGEINQSSLFSLPFLESLNLANNSFQLEQIPSSFGNLTSLRLAVLDLSSLHFPETPSLLLENPSLLTLLQNLKGLIELHLDGGLLMFLFRISGFFPEINLDSNNLFAPVPEFFASFPNLTALSLRSSNLYGTFPEKIFQVPTLQTLQLESNSLLSGSLPEFPRNSNLKKLVLSETNFSGALPDSIGNLRNLSRIELAFCRFSGPIPNSLEDLAQLVRLDLSSNVFTGPIPSFQMSKNLSSI